MDCGIFHIQHITRISGIVRVRLTPRRATLSDEARSDRCKSLFNLPSERSSKYLVIRVRFRIRSIEEFSFIRYVYKLRYVEHLRRSFIIYKMKINCIVTSLSFSKVWKKIIKSLRSNPN